MSDTLYIQTDKNMKVTREIVTLGEIADLSCKNSAVLARNQVRKVASLPREKYGRYVISMIDVILPVFCGVGVVIGVGGSLIAIRKFLQV